MGNDQASPLQRLLTDCELLMGEIDEPAIRALADHILTGYESLPTGDRLGADARFRFLGHLLQRYGADPVRIRQAFAEWDRAGAGDPELVELFNSVEPRRQQLLRRLNHAPQGTARLVAMRADLRALMRSHPELEPLDVDFRHLFNSWFNRGFLRMARVHWDSPDALLESLIRYEKVHPLAGREELRRRLQPADRRCFAFFHPATGDVPLIFVEVGLVQGIPRHVAPLLEPGPVLDPALADTAVLYSINNALDGLVGVSFGSLLIKQVIDELRAELPQIAEFVTLSPIPGFRAWLRAHDTVFDRLLESGTGQPDRETLRPALLELIADYLVRQTRVDGKPIDPVARFHLGNGATAWQLNWRACTSDEMWRQSFGVMVNYRYEPGMFEQHRAGFRRPRSVAADSPLASLLPPIRPTTTSTSEEPIR